MLELYVYGIKRQFNDRSDKYIIGSYQTFCSLLCLKTVFCKVIEMTCPPFMVLQNSDCRVGYSNLYTLTEFTIKKLPILKIVYKKKFFKRISHFLRICIPRLKESHFCVCTIFNGPAANLILFFIWE
jgi:hypothetical protein